MGTKWLTGRISWKKGIHTLGSVEQVLQRFHHSTQVFTHVSLQPYGLKPTRLLCPWDFPGKNTGVGCHFLLQRIIWTQGLKLHLLDTLPQAWEAMIFRTACNLKLINCLFFLNFSFNIFRPCSTVENWNREKQNCRKGCWGVVGWGTGYYKKLFWWFHKFIS